MPRPRNPNLWYKDISEMGVELTLKERTRGGRIYAHGRVEGERIRKSTKTTDRQLAEERGRRLAREIARQLLGVPAAAHQETADPTLGELLETWRQEKKHTYNGTRGRLLDQRASFLEKLWGSGTPVSYLDQDDVDEAVRAVMGRKGVESRTTARHFLTGVSTILNWATRKKREGRPLLSENPLQDLRFPARSENGARPTASHERYLKTLRAARHTPMIYEGALVTALTLVRYQGRRINSVRQLRWDDIGLTEPELKRQLARLGASPKIAEYWPQGGVVWRHDTDKEDRQHVSPLHEAAARALRYHRRRLRRQGVKSDWLFPSPVKRNASVSLTTFDRWLRETEESARQRGAGVLDLTGGLWHPYRRLWRGERARFHPKAVAYAGGWKYDGGPQAWAAAMNQGYLPVPPPVLYDVVAASLAPDGRMVGTADERLWSFEGWEDLW